MAIISAGLFFSVVAIATDTAFYTGPESTASFRALFSYVRSAPVVTPLNNLRYNLQGSNLAEHGLHPHYQHFLVNLPQLLGPAFVWFLYSMWPLSKRKLQSMICHPRLSSATAGSFLLSIIPHQEPRFLLPCIPLILTYLQPSTSPKHRRLFWLSWALFNAVMGVLMGTYHQGGVIPAQIAIPDLVSKQIELNGYPRAQVFWWKTYPPPTYLLGMPPASNARTPPINITTTTLMGRPQPQLLSTLQQAVIENTPSCATNKNSFLEFLLPQSRYTDTYLAAPFSAWRFDDSVSLKGPRGNTLQQVNSTIIYKGEQDEEDETEKDKEQGQLVLTLLYQYHKHVNLDDMDFAEDGVGSTLARVVGRRGLGVWKVTRLCKTNEGA